MIPADPLGDASRRLQRSLSADGLNDIAVGVVLVSLPLFELAKALAGPPGSPPWQILNLLQMLMLAPGIWLAMWAVPRLRNRWFGHRQGTMIPLRVTERPASGWGKVLAALVAGMISASVLVVFLKGAASSAAPLAVLAAGLAMAAIFWMVSRTGGAQRYLWLSGTIALFTAALSSAMPGLGLDLEAGLSIEFGFAGLLCLVAGLVTLSRYLREDAPGETL